MTKDEAMQMALTVLERTYKMDSNDPQFQAVKALCTALAQPEPEPVAWLTRDSIDGCWYATNKKQSSDDKPLYTVPPQRKPLSDDELLAALKSVDSETARLPNGFKLFARAIEAAHGIGEEK